MKAGDRAPDFELPADDGSQVRLSELKGQKVVLYFYPRDNTPGCTTEACEFRDSLPRFGGVGAVVLGVSPDSVASHRKFKEKHDLNFLLLSDQDRAVAEAYGVFKEKSMYGRVLKGIERSTFLIDEEGIVRQVWTKVRARGHAEKVAEALAG